MSERDEFEAWWQRGEWNVAAKDLAWRDMCRMAFHAGRATQAVPALTDEQIREISREYWDTDGFISYQDQISFARAIFAMSASREDE